MNLIHPSLIIDEQRCKKNINAMVQRAGDYGLNFKPHFKTHQSKIVGQWFREQGVSGITVSSIAMANYFADEGWNDITIAIPVNVRAIEELNILASKVQLTILVNSLNTAKALGDNLKERVNVLIEVDAGSNRTGILPKKVEEIVNLSDKINGLSKLNWKGFYSHFGHTYQCRGVSEVRNVFQDSLDRINKMISKGRFENVELHIGDTPGCSLADNFEGITTITPGNFVFYDVMQQRIGSCTAEQIAVVMACPVIEKNETRQECTVHGGAVHFSKDYILINDEPCYGILVALNNDGIGEEKNGRLIRLSQEHGTLTMEKDIFSKIRIGDVLGILPIHSCLTADCMGNYVGFNGNYIDHL